MKRYTDPGIKVSMFADDSILTDASGGAGGTTSEYSAWVSSKGAAQLEKDLSDFSRISNMAE